MRANPGFLFAALPLRLPLPADTGLQQRTLEGSFERIPRFPSPSSPAKLPLKLEHYLFVCLFKILVWECYLVNNRVLKIVKYAFLGFFWT